MATALIANNLPIPSALGSLDAYISAVNSVPVLTVEEEQALARAYRDEEDLDAALAVGVDYVILDGRGGGTGAAPLLFREELSTESNEPARFVARRRIRPRETT